MRNPPPTDKPAAFRDLAAPCQAPAHPAPGISTKHQDLPFDRNYPPVLLEVCQTITNAVVCAESKLNKGPIEDDPTEKGMQSSDSTRIT